MASVGRRSQLILVFGGLLPAHEMTRERLSADEVVAFRRSAARWLVAFWVASGVGVFVHAARSGTAAELTGAEEAVALPVLAAGIALFPGAQITDFIGTLAGLRLAIPEGDWPATFVAAAVALLVVAILTTAFFWTTFLPWVVTAFRIYLWPHRLRRRGDA